MSTSTTIPPSPSSLTALISSSPKNPLTPLSATTAQILHNLQHQHLWSSLQIHEFKTTANKPSSSKRNNDNTNSAPSPTLLISGIPPNRIYTHPDEQLFLLEKGLREDDVPPERFFVLPTVRGQSWSLGRMAGVFDVLPTTTTTDSSEVESENEIRRGSMGLRVSGDGGNNDDDDDDDKEASGSLKKEKKLEEYYAYREKARRTGDWGGKRLLLAMVDKGLGGEGTVVYYVVQEGAVKPRQN